MKMNFVRPKDKPKPFKFELSKVCKREDYESEWNVFSNTPKPGEPYGKYNFNNEDR